MKITRLLLLSAFLVGISACGDEAPKATPYFNPTGDYESIFRLMHPPQVPASGFDGSPAMDIWFAPSASQLRPWSRGDPICRTNNPAETRAERKPQ